MLRHWWPRFLFRKLGPAASKRTVMHTLNAPDDSDTGAKEMNLSQNRRALSDNEHPGHSLAVQRSDFVAE